MNAIDLKGRHAVVTGGAQGIGLSVARRLLLSGASVTLWDFDEATLNEALKLLGSDGSVSGAVSDVADYASVEAALGTTIARHGRVDILVANAGIAGPTHTTWEYPLEEFQRVLQINLMASSTAAALLFPACWPRTTVAS